MEMRKSGKVENSGVDSDGNKYKSMDAMWKRALESGKGEWYDHGARYWDGVEATVNGVLGGFPEVHQPDMIDS
jgi:protein N-terminal methyltransferase